jgi:hypothetical protein
MATFYGVNATKRDNSVPSKKIDAQDAGGRLRVAYDEITLAGAVTTSDVIKMMKLPSGARILDAILSSADLGTTGALNVGWEANGVDSAVAAGLFSAVDVNTAAISVRQSSTYSTNQFKKLGAETQISIVPSANTTAGGKISLAVFYALD